MSLLFINNTQETFTPTQSGALATIIWECCRVAERQNLKPVVMTRGCPAAPFPWPATTLIDYPAVPTGKLGVLLCRADRKIAGWRYLRQREYAGRLVKSIRAAGLQNLPMVLINDPETAVVLRDAFPAARIVHWFQNQQECKQKYRGRFAGAVDAVAGCSDFISRWVEGYYKLCSGGVETIYNGVDSMAFFPMNVPQEGLVVVNFVGRTGIEKGPDLLLRAAIEVAKSGRSFSIQLIGSNHWDRFEMDEYQQTLLELVQELEVMGISVRRPGHVGRPNLPAELQRAHIHVVPARWDEPFGMTTIEGMACGLATIASRTGGTPEVVDGSGLLFERNSVEGLAAQLDLLLSDFALRQEYREKARCRAKEFSWDRTWAGISQLALA